MDTFYNVLTFMLIFPVLIIGCLKALCEGGIDSFGWKPVNRIYKPASCQSSSITPLQSFIKIFIYAVLFRIVTYLLSYLVLRTLVYPTGTFDISVILRDWVRWDANNYIRIATLGYDGYYENGIATTLVFFPLYSWIMRFFHIFIPSIAACGLIVSTICYGLGCAFLYGLVREDYGHNVAKKAVTLISIFPFAFFFGAIMPESTFFFTACACMYFAKKRRFVISGIFGALASLSRMQGLLLAVFFTAQWLIAYRPFELIKNKDYKALWHKIFTKLSPIFIIPIGAVIYLYQNYLVTGDPFKFLEYQEIVWGQTPQYIGTTIADNVANLKINFFENSQSICVWLPQLVLFFLCCATLLYGLNKVSSGYILFLVLYLIMNYTPSYLLSGGRYMSVAFPMFIILGIFFEKHPKLWDVAIITSALLYTLYMGIYLNYGFVF